MPVPDFLWKFFLFVFRKRVRWEREEGWKGRRFFRISQKIQSVVAPANYFRYISYGTLFTSALIMSPKVLSSELWSGIHSANQIWSIIYSKGIIDHEKY